MAGITTEGFVPKTYDEIVEGINRSMKDNFGENFDTSPENPDGQIISIVSSALSEQWLLAEASYNSFNPSKSFGLGLDNLVQMNGMHRLEGDVSKASVTFIGEAGTTIPSGTVISNVDGDLFTTSQAAVLPSTNTPVESLEFGIVNVAAGAINILVTTIIGLTSVSNDVDGYTEYEEESDADLRARRAVGTVSSGTSSINAIYSAFARIGVRDVYVEENVSGAALPSGQPDKTVRVIADKATVEDIATVIFNNKTTGIPSYGSLSHVINDDGGHPHTIFYDRPTYVNVHMAINIQLKSSAQPTYELDIKNMLTEHINNINIGNDVVWSDAMLRMAEIDGIIIKQFHIGTALGNESQNDIEVDADQKVITDITKIALELV